MRWILPHVYLRLIAYHFDRHEDDQVLKLLNKTLPKAKSVQDNYAAGVLYRQYARFCIRSGRHAEAIEHFVASRTTLRRTEHRVEQALTELDYGAFILEEEKRGERGQVQTAIKLLKSARRIFDRAGMVVPLQRCDRLLDECQRTLAAGGLDSLLERADLRRPLASLRSEATQQFSELHERFAQQLDETMDGKAILESFATQLRDVERNLLGRIGDLERGNQELLVQLDQLRLERRNLLRLQEINTKISSTLEPQQLLELILDTAIELLEAERGFVVLINAAGEPECRVARNLAQQQIEDPIAGLSRSIVRKVLRNREPLLTTDASADARFDGASIQELQLKSLMCVPLECKGVVIGALYVDGSGQGHFDHRALELACAFGSLAAIALENARLYDQLRQKERIEQELSLAARIQKSLLPRQQPQVAGLEVHGRMVPAGQLGGDYYDFIERDGNLAICIGDVSGKGVPAGLVMVMARLFLHHWDVERADTKATMLAANRILHANTEPFVFMSMLLLYWDAHQQQLRYSGAGHETLLIYRAVQKTVESLPSGGVVLGIKADISAFVEERTLPLQPGDVVLLYTDGATEALNVRGEQFGLDRLKAAFAAQADKNAAAIVDELCCVLQDFASGRAQHDDITLAVLRCTTE
jgi:serine phosphatase RsbU (regulator of sigma subunit)